MNTEIKKIIEQWNNASEMYSKEQKTSSNHFTNWQILKEVIGDVKEKNILDAGSGDGSFANELKIMGANVFACDGSVKLIDIAKRDFKDIDFQLCDITDKLNYVDKKFDLVVSSLVLMDIIDIDKFLMESNRVLKDDGRLIFSIVHPCFFGGDWNYDENGNKKSKILNDYWNQSKIIVNAWGETTHYHRPITWYSKKLKEAGFLIECIQENPDDTNKFEMMKLHQKRIPLFICFSCVKKS